MEIDLFSAIPLIYSFDDNPFRTTGVPSGVGMTGRFVVTKELLQLSMQASQHLEMSENLGKVHRSIYV